MRDFIPEVMDDLRDNYMCEWLIESNAIEGEFEDDIALMRQMDATKAFIDKDQVFVQDLEELVGVFAPHAVLRRQEGLNVIVGSHRPPPGGLLIEKYLTRLLNECEHGSWSPFEAHIKYETLHPFTDGNGRTGRVLWARMMELEGVSPFRPINGNEPSFLHRFYYQTLENSRQ